MLLGLLLSQYELSPPIGPSYLRHMLKHPEDFDGEYIAYSSTPKRRFRLDMGTGWGIELVEGFAPERVRDAVLGLLGLGCLLFVVNWLCSTGGDGWTVLRSTAAMTGSAALLLTAAQAALE